MMPESESSSSSTQVTALLRLASAGDRDAANEFIKSIERDLRRLASIHMSRERDSHTLQTTALMNEAFMRLFGVSPGRGVQWADRKHFFAVASQAMRRILVDYARGRSSDKRRGCMVRLELADLPVSQINPQVLDIHIALEEFAQFAPRQAQLVELRFFGGMSLEEAAEVLGISERTTDKDWAIAKAWLRKRLGPADECD